MTDKIKFRPVEGTQANILRMIDSGQGQEGDIYFAYDVGLIYFVKNGETYTIGGSGSGGTSFIWANGEEDAEDATTLFKVNNDDDTDPRYLMSVFAIEGSTPDFPKYPDKGLLVINSDGRFFRVTGTEAESNMVALTLIAVSGTGGGGGSSSTEDLILSMGSELYDGAVFLYGQQKNLTLVATSLKDSKVQITTTIDDLEHDKTYETTVSYQSGKIFNIDAATLPESQNLMITVKITSPNTSMKPAQRPKRVIPNIKVVKIGLQKYDEDAFIPLIKPDNSLGELQLTYIPYGDPAIEETLHVYVDNEEIRKEGTLGYPRIINSSIFNSSDIVNIPRQSHGVHNIQLKASVVLNGETIYTDPIEFEGAWASANEDKPIIWVGGYDATIVNYENSYIRYMVYDPIKEANNLPATVYKYKDSIKILESEEAYKADEWWLWDITNAYTVGAQTFSISCRNTRVDIPINVTTEGSRDLGLKNVGALQLNLTAAGRSNSEVKSTRSTWTDTVANQQAILTGFNWQTNGWKNDGKDTVTGIDNGTYLSLTNGASISIPCNRITLNYDNDYSIEMRLRIRNVQQYSTLVQSLPLYYYYEDVFTPVAAGAEFNSEITYYTRHTEGNGAEAIDIYEIAEINEFEENVTYYTRSRGAQSEKGALMTWINENHKELVYDNYGSPLMDEDNVSKSYKTTEGVICKWMNNNDQGLVIGSQEAYFRSPRGVISVRYKENEIINISVVISKADNLVYIYLNGILSGADALPKDSFEIYSPFVFNSDYCDIDIYRFRVFNTKLSMPDVIHNYLSDLHSIVLYDQNQLTEARTPTDLEYDLLVNYNTNHPGAQTMPYAVWTIKDANRAEKLPYFKGDGCKADIEFINPCADEALENGVIDEWTYYTGCPSFKAYDVEIDVQGTSSQGYPRRNYKTKYKKATSWVFTKGSLAGQSIAKDHEVLETLDSNGNPLLTPITHTLSKNYHMDNHTYGTNKFTWKIDYMESSGTYNTGFANLMGNLKYPLYTKHPLADLGIDATDLRTTVYGFPVLTFHKYLTPSNNPTKQNATYEYIGRYNMNLDKGSNEYYGFESKLIQPYVTRTREVVNEETGETTIEEYHPAIKDIAECWELEDNQGTWCSFKYPNATARSTRFGTTWPDNPNRLEVMRHFEYRYSAYGDQLDAIGADGKYDGTTNDEAIIAEIGTTDAEKSEYVRRVYSNLEVLFDWLDSTDQSSATNNDLINQFEVKTEKEYTATGESSAAVMAFNKVPEGANFKKNEEYYIKIGNDNTAASFQRVEIEQFAPNTDYYIYSISYYNTTFTKDTPGYRLEKFRTEFTKHLDKEYCIIYFILTELLLCYDSRGKNMMLATWGPREANGDYVWYPVFYDIDTQLGLNNSGAYLWDYDADVTLDGLFSTPSSVLWTNLFAAFENDIKNKYRALRGVDDNSSVVNNLTYEKITGAYECNPEVFGSWAMKGIRPITAIGLDEYYKYFATTKTGYFDTSGTKIIEDTPEYAYACQGDKKLTTELLLRNRLNYIDSWWLGGNYQINMVKQGQFWGRVNGNRKQTSDKYLDISDEAIQEQINAGQTKYEGFEHKTYPYKYYDSTPGFKLKPFLKQYVTFFTDEVPGTPVKYEANDDQKDGVETFVNSDTIETYKNDPESPNEQLVYIPGVDYLSSLGDLSTSYFSEFTLTAGARLLDLTLGSDAPGYKNTLLKAGDGGKFTIADGPNSTTKKSLLRKINFTGITSLQGTVDTRGSEKLEEFRALRTNLGNVYFADGAPLHTVHLPATLETIELIGADNINRILTSSPTVATMVNGELVYENANNYKGLYIENLTDYNGIGHTGHKLNRISIEGGGLGYDSYKLLDNIVKIKTGANENAEAAISLKDVKWSPYILVAEGEHYDSTIQYYLLTDHSTFVEYNDLTDNNWVLDQEDWNYKLLNNKIYIYNENYNKDPNQGIVQENTIQNLNMLNNFITAYEDEKANDQSQGTQFHNTVTNISVPSITGEIYVANTTETKIAEDTLTSVYKKYWPNLNIYAAYVIESYISKFIQINDSGKEEELVVNKLNPQTTEQPTIDITLIPEKQYYDFIGWSLDKEGTKIVSDFVYNDDDDHSAGGTFNNHFNDYEQEMTFNDETNSVITLYAIFVKHKYKTYFDFDDGKPNRLVLTEWSINPGLNVPLEIPAKEYSIADDEYTQTEELGLYRKYKFSHWAYTTDQTQSAINLTTLIPDRNRSFKAIYEDVSVYDDVLDNKYLIFEKYNNQEEYWQLSVNSDYTLSGKITLPVQKDNKYVYAISGFNSQNQITHIFFEQNENRQLTTIGTLCFQNCTNLKYVEPINTLTNFGNSAFSQCQSLQLSNIESLIKNGNTFGNTLFSNNTQQGELKISGHNISYIGERSFSTFPYISSLIIGFDEPLKWIDLLNNTSNIFDRPGNLRGGLTKLHIYIPSAYQDKTDEIMLKLGLSAYVTNMSVNNLNDNYTWIILDDEG